MASLTPQAQVIFDQQNLVSVRKRFLKINQDRLKRMRDALLDRQQIFLDSLTLLFHSNHPMLPGFVSRNTPARVSNFKPDKTDIRVARTIARSFTVAYEPDKQDDIYAIYIMGSVGTIAQSEGSDLDIWLCYRPDLSAEEIAELEVKSKKISQWAESFGLEAHFFLMDHEAFKAGKQADLDAEASGSAQKMLLLDEFYRTAIHISGRLPLWWFVPHAQEVDYTEYTNVLLSKRFISNKTVLDFGDGSQIPDGEFVGAGVWQLYKAIESPYKAVLKLLLLEAYVHEYPTITPLSLTYKSLVYQGSSGVDALDSYVMIYRKIESYLNQINAPARLELARRCFYIKVNKQLSRPPMRRQKSWQRILLEDLVEEWGWSEEQIQLMDRRSTWKTPRVIQERTLLVNELNHTYSVLMEFATTIGAKRKISSEELTILGRKLHAAYERRPGKIEWINPNISDDLSENMITVDCEFDPATRQTIWVAYTADSDSLGNEKIALKSCEHLVELSLWCYFNGIINTDTRLEVANENYIARQEFSRLFEVFNLWLPLTQAHDNHDAFKSASSPRRVLILVNVASSPPAPAQSQGFQRLSERSDALRYGGFETNLITSVDLVTINSWDEISTRRFEGSQALTEAALQYLQYCLPGTHQTPPSIEIKCINNAFTLTIENRLESWFREILKAFYSDRARPNNRYLFQLAKEYVCLQFYGMRPQAHTFSSEQNVVDYLAKEQRNFSDIVIDSHTLKNHPLRNIIQLIKPNRIELFFRRFDIGMEIYACDERGSIAHTLYHGQRDYNPLRALHRFLRSVTQRQIRQYPDNFPEASLDFGVFPIVFYELEQNNDRSYRCMQRNVSKEISGASKFEVRAIAHLDKNDEVTFDFSCDDQVFSAFSFGEQLDIVVAQYILAQRESEENYPVYLTDMDLTLAENTLSENGRLQVSHYLKIKEQLESRLNQAIGILLNA